MVTPPDLWLTFDWPYYIAAPPPFLEAEVALWLEHLSHILRVHGLVTPARGGPIEMGTWPFVEQDEED